MTPNDAADRQGRGPDVDLAAVVRRALSALHGMDPELAREAGLPRRRLAQIRKGDARPTPEEVAALADALASGSARDLLDPESADLAERVLRMALEMGVNGAD